MRSDKLFRSYCAAPQPRRHPDLDQIRLDQHGLARPAVGAQGGRAVGAPAITGSRPPRRDVDDTVPACAVLPAGEAEAFHLHQPVPTGRVQGSSVGSSATEGGGPVLSFDTCRKLGTDTVTQSGSPRGPSSPELGSRTP